MGPLPVGQRRGQPGLHAKARRLAEHRRGRTPEQLGGAILDGEPVSSRPPAHPSRDRVAPIEVAGPAGRLMVLVAVCAPDPHGFSSASSASRRSRNC